MTSPFNPSNRGMMTNAAGGQPQQPPPNADGSFWGHGSFVRNWLGNTTHPMQQQQQGAQMPPGMQQMPGMQPQMQRMMPYRPIGMPGGSPLSFLMAAMGRR